MMPELQVGPECRLRYRLIRRLGAGAMGEVHLAEDRKLRRQVALKFLREDEIGPSLHGRFLEEARALAKLRHPHILEVLDWGDADTFPFIALEFVTGESLRARLLREGIPPLESSLRWMDELCDAMAFAHGQGILHRDLKPANLLLDGAGRVKVADFGLAKRGDRREELTRTGLLLGTPSHLAPECIQGEPASVASDLYAMACLLHELLTGRLPFPGENVAEVLHAHCVAAVPDPGHLRSDLSPEIRQLVKRALAKKPEERFPDVSGFRAALRAVPPPSSSASVQGRAPTMQLAPPSLRKGGAETLRPPSLRRDSGEKAKRRKVFFGLSALGAFVLVVLAFRLLPREVRPPEGLSIQVGGNGVLATWSSDEAEAWAWELRSQSGTGEGTRGRETQASRIHRIVVKALASGRRYRLTLERQGRRFEHVFETPRPALEGRVTAIALDGRFWIDYRMEPEGKLRLTVSGAGRRTSAARSWDLPPRGPVCKVLRGETAGISHYVWRLEASGRILARGRTNLRPPGVPLEELEGAKREAASLNQPPLWVGSSLFCADEFGGLTAYALGSKATALPEAERVSRPVLRRSWVLRPSGATLSYRRVPGGLVPLDGGSVLWICGGVGAEGGFFHVVDPKARAEGWEALAAKGARGEGAHLPREHPWNGPLGKGEWTIPWPFAGNLVGSVLRHGRKVFFRYRFEGLHLASFDLSSRRVLWTVALPEEEEGGSGYWSTAGDMLWWKDRLYCFTRRGRPVPSRGYAFRLLSCRVEGDAAPQKVAVLDRFETPVWQQNLAIDRRREAVTYCRADEIRSLRFDDEGRAFIEGLGLPRPGGGEFGRPNDGSSYLLGPCFPHPDGTLVLACESLDRKKTLAGLDDFRARFMSLKRSGGQRVARKVDCQVFLVDRAPWLLDLFEARHGVVGVTNSWIFTGHGAASPSGGQIMLTSSGLRHASLSEDDLLAVAGLSRLWVFPLALLPGYGPKN